MLITYDIINKNLEKLEEATKAFPDILGKYRKTNDVKIRSEISTLASKIGLSEYIGFINWIENVQTKNLQVVYKNTINFDVLKSEMSERGYDINFKDLIKTKTKKGFITFLKNDFEKYNGGSYGRGYRRKYYSQNLQPVESILMNYVIQNEINWDYSFGKYYINNLPNFEYKINEELEVTKDITKSIIRKINSMKFDFRRLNFNILKSEIESKIREKILSVEKDEQIRCLEEVPGLTLNKVYFVRSYTIGSNGNLTVCIINDNNVERNYNYRIFENVSKLRDDKLDNLLAIFE